MYPLFYLLKKVVISCLIFLYFGLGTDTKKEQRKLLKVLCLQGLHGTPRARMREEKNGEVRPGLYMRERERVYKYLELPNILLSFSRLFFSPYSMIQT